MVWSYSHCCLLHELNVDEVRLRTVRPVKDEGNPLVLGVFILQFSSLLPVCFLGAITQLRHPKSWLAGGERPHSVDSNLQRLWLARCRHQLARVPRIRGTHWLARAAQLGRPRCGLQLVCSSAELNFFLCIRTSG